MTISTIKGNLFCDDRGYLRFVNDFDFSGVKRFYQVENHDSGFVRAWHGHKNEGKYAYVVKGSALFGLVDLTTEEVVLKQVLTSQSPQILVIPPNHANGFMTLECGTIIIFFSTSTIDESRGDDIRFPADRWNIWEVVCR
jgi:dTDP-4-dehydrorhamnose 3,5-epimerase